jgi:hypothetical protein
VLLLRWPSFFARFCTVGENGPAKARNRVKKGASAFRTHSLMIESHLGQPNPLLSSTEKEENPSRREWRAEGKDSKFTLIDEEKAKKFKCH